MSDDLNMINALMKSYMEPSLSEKEKDILDRAMLKIYTESNEEDVKG